MLPDLVERQSGLRLGEEEDAAGTFANRDASLKTSLWNHCMARSISSVLMWNNAALGLSMS